MRQCSDMSVDADPDFDLLRQMFFWAVRCKKHEWPAFLEYARPEFIAFEQKWTQFQERRSAMTEQDGNVEIEGTGLSDTPDAGVNETSKDTPVTTDVQDTQRDGPSNMDKVIRPTGDTGTTSTSVPQVRSGAPLRETQARPTSVLQSNPLPQTPTPPTTSMNPPISPQRSQSVKHSPAPVQPTPPAASSQSGQHQKAARTVATTPPKPDSPPPPTPLPNGTVGKAYKFNILKGFGSPTDLIDVTIDGLEGTGLHLDLENIILEGIPEKAGDFSPVLRYRSKKQIDQSRYVRRVLALTINADPKSLWKDLPSDKSDPYWKPDSDSNALLQGRSLIAASQRGRSHAHEGKFRDDDFGLAYLDDGWYLAAVADGAGSSKSSRRGSQIVCSCALDHLKQNIAKEFDGSFEARLLEHVQDRGKEAVQKAIRDKVYTLLAGAAHLGFKKIQEEANSHSVPPKDYATTLIAAVMRRYDFGWFVGAYWVGDGGIGIYSRNSEVRLLGEPDGGEFAGQTRFITMPEVWEANEIYRRVRFEVVDDFTAVILMTDGITDAKFESENNLKNVEKWDGLWDDLTQTVPLTRRDGSPEKALLQWLDFWSPGNHDDRTIAILV